MSFNLASSILRGAWVIDPAFARSQIPFLVNIVNGTTQFDALTDDEKKEFEPYSYAVSNNVASVMASANYGENGKPENTKYVRVIPVVGVMMKYSQDCGPRGTMDIGRNIEQAANDKDTDAIIIKFDTPGGMVSGIQTFSDKIKSAREKKPVIAFVDDGLCCSAGYWAASSCTEIISSQKTDTIGSIGVYITLADFKGMFEKQGLKIHEIYADQSTGKNSSYREAMKGNYKPIKAEDLNPIAELFINTVKENRAGKLNAAKGDPFKGDTFMAERALEIGLIDSIGSLEFAVNRAAELSNASTSATHQNENLNLTNTDMKMKIMSSQVALAALLAVSFASGETEKEVELTAANLETINAKLTSDASAIDAHAATIATHEATIAERNETIATQTSKITKLESMSSNPQTETTVTTTAEGAPGEAKDEVKSETTLELERLQASMKVG